MLFRHEPVNASPSPKALDEAAQLPSPPQRRPPLNAVLSQAPSVKQERLSGMNSHDRPKEGANQPTVPGRAAREDGVYNAPRRRPGQKPRQARRAEEVKSDAAEHSQLNRDRGPVLGDDDVADAERLAGGHVHLHEAGAGVGPALQWGDQGHGVVEAAGADVHRVKGNVKQRGLGRLARGEAVVVAQVVGELTRVLAVHVGNDALLAGGVCVVGCHFLWMRRLCCFMYR